MRPLRLTLVEFSPSGGLFQFSLQLGEGLATIGHQIELITGHEPELAPRTAGMRVLAVLPTWRPQSPRVEPVWLRKVRRVWRALCYLEAWRRTWHHIRRTRPDVVQFSEWRFGLDGLIVALLARWTPGTVFAAVAHTPRPLVEQRSRGALHKSSPVLHRTLAAAYRRMDVVFVLGERSKADLLAAFPQVRKVEVIPHGDANALVDDLVTPAGAAPRRVLFFGTIARYKGVDLLLEAWAQLRMVDPDAELLIAGAPVDIDPDELRRAAAAVGGVEVRLGYVPLDRVAGLVSGARVVVAPYRTANQSGVIALAQTLARPVVATDVGDLGQVVIDGETGLLVPPDDPAALAEALLALLNDPAAAERLGAAARERLVTSGSWREVATRVAGVYDTLTPAEPLRGDAPSAAGS